MHKLKEPRKLWNADHREYKQKERRSFEVWAPDNDQWKDFLAAFTKSKKFQIHSLIQHTLLSLHSLC